MFGLGWHSPAQAETSAPPVVTTPAVTVHASRFDVGAGDLPVSLDVVDVDTGRDGKPGVNLCEQLTGVPGVLARDRQNYAQDAQVSIRGFGARATFGVRGVRLYADGIPATMPDGQGQVSHFSLEAADRIEVLRGPFAVLYGNASGGAIQIWSADGDPPLTRLGLDAGGYGVFHAAASTRGHDGDIDYNLAASHFQTDGYRDHSRARRESLNARLGIALSPDSRLTLVANAIDLPQAQDPLGLTWAQYRADPRQAVAAAEQFDTRKSVFQGQFGAVFGHDVGTDNSLRAMAYYGSRDVWQMLSIPVAAQRNPLSSGGVVDLANEYGGTDLRWTHRGVLAARPYEFVLGLSYDDQRQHRRGYDNFIGSTLGVRGALRRDEDNRVHNLDQYAQWYWSFADDASLVAGVRRSRVEFRSRDHYVTATNPDDSGRTQYGATTPMLGLVYRATPMLRLHASIGEGFDTPTFSELSYRADGGAGLAFSLPASDSRTAEIGLTWQAGERAQLDAAVFRVDSEHELAVATNVGGRSTYQDVGDTRRQGVELSASADLGRGWQLRAGMTWLSAQFEDDFLTCGGSACAVPVIPVSAGTHLPGVPARYGSLRLGRDADIGWSGGLQVDGVSSVTTNDTASESAPGYALLGLDVGYAWGRDDNRLRWTLRADNVFDRDYIGSVIVNEGNGRYYEPGPGRSVMLAVRWER